MLHNIREAKRETMMPKTWVELEDDPTVLENIVHSAVAAEAWDKIVHNLLQTTHNENNIDSNIDDVTTHTQDLSQALVLSDNQFLPLFVEDSQPMSEMARDSKVEVIDGPDKPFEKPFDKPFDPIHGRKRKRGGLMEEEINVFCSMTEAVKEVATAIMVCKPLDVHPDLYGAVMTEGGFSDDALMAALSHLLDNKAQAVGFVAMANAHKVLWLGSWLGKHNY
ncbi:Translational activator GCN1 [Hordeum vulgare]|nr:Translational activator GCN1 [Hordeum vulgare]